MAFQKITYQPGDVLTSEQMNNIQDVIGKNEGNIDSHIANKSNPHGTTPSQIGAAEAGHKHSASDINSGTLAIAQGGTGASDGATALANLFAAGETILSSNQYGNDLPTEATKGRWFLKKA